MFSELIVAGVPGQVALWLNSNNRLQHILRQKGWIHKRQFHTQPKVGSLLGFWQNINTAGSWWPSSAVHSA